MVNTRKQTSSIHAYNVKTDNQDTHENTVEKKCHHGRESTPSIHVNLDDALQSWKYPDP